MRIWQILFLLGVIALMVTMAFAFGLSSLTAIVGGAAVIVSIVNGLLSNPSANNPGGNWLLSTLKSLLNVSKFLKAVTVLIWIASIGAAGYALYAANEALKESRKITIEGLVLTAAGEPAEKAVVTLFLTRGNLQAVTDKGKFIFQKVSLEGEQPAKVRLQARLGKEETETVLDLTNGPPHDLTMQMPPGDPPFRVSYFLLKHQAVDFLLQGKMDPDWEDKLAGQPFIVPNAVYKTLSGFAASFSETASEEVRTFDFKKESNDGQTLEEKSGAAEVYNVKSFFAGGAHSGIIDLDTQLVYKYLHSLGDTSQRWRLLVNTAIGDKIPDSFVLRKSVDRNDLSAISNSPLRRFYSLITAENMPADFGYIDLYLSGGCSDEDEPRYTDARFIGRDLSLRVAVIENITNQPIQIGDFILRENSAGRLRSREDDKNFLNNQEPQRQALFPPQSLKPGEKILIPAEMILGFDRKIRPFVSDKLILPEAQSHLSNEIENEYQLDFPVYEVSHQPGSESVSSRTVDVYVDSKDVQDILSNTTEMVSFDSEYLYGPSVEIEGLEVDKVKYPFRHFDPTKIVIYAETDTGSCPYVYTYASGSKTWLNEGVILYGRNSETKEAVDEKQLRMFDGRLLIREKDPEESSIDSIYLRVIAPDGGEVILYPRNSKLRYADSKYLRLKQGQQVVVDFDPLPNGYIVSKLILAAKGYYIPYR
jgi:hypothetical protein